MIINYGAAAQKAFAAIGVTYPEGSICTCTNGQKTLKAKDKSGECLFLLPSGGDWTVSCTDGIKTNSRPVQDITQYSLHTIALAYSFYLIQDGELVNDFQFTSPLIVNRSLNQTETTDAKGLRIRRFSNTAVGFTGGLATTSMFDVSPYNFLHIDYSMKVATTNKPGGILTKTLNSSDVNKLISNSLVNGYNESTVRDIADINIQDINEACYIGLYVTATSSAINSIDVYNFWLE